MSHSICPPLTTINSWSQLASWSSKIWSLFNSQVFPRKAIYLRAQKEKILLVEYIKADKNFLT